MKLPDYVQRLFECFPKSFINTHTEIVLLFPENVWFRLEDVESENDVKCKLCEWVSRWIDKGYIDDDDRKYLLDGFNEYCGTSFNRYDFDLIYTYLGNAIRHEATKEFVACDFDLEFLKKFAKEREVARCERMKQGES